MASPRPHPSPVLISSPSSTRPLPHSLPPLRDAAASTPSPARCCCHFIPLLHAMRIRKSGSSRHAFLHPKSGFSRHIATQSSGGVAGQRQIAGVREVNGTTVNPLVGARVRMKPHAPPSRGFLVLPALLWPPAGNEASFGHGFHGRRPRATSDLVRRATRPTPPSRRAYVAPHPPGTM